MSDAEASDEAPKVFDRMLFARRVFAAAGLALLAYGVAQLFLVQALGLCTIDALHADVLADRRFMDLVRVQLRAVLGEPG